MINKNILLNNHNAPVVVVQVLHMYGYFCFTTFTLYNTNTDIRRILAVSFNMVHDAHTVRT